MFSSGGSKESSIAVWFKMWIYMQLCGTPGDWKNRAVGSLNCLNISNQTILASIWNTPRLSYTKYSKAFLDKKLDIWKRCSSIAFFPDLKAPPFPNKYRLGLHKKLGATKLPLEWIKPLQNFFISVYPFLGMKNREKLHLDINSSD